jgi:hypothetical protein
VKGEGRTLLGDSGLHCEGALEDIWERAEAHWMLLDNKGNKIINHYEM